VLRLETRLALASQVLDWRWDSLAGDALRLYQVRNFTGADRPPQRVDGWVL